MTGLTRAARVEALSLIKSRDRLLEAVLSKDKTRVRNAMLLARTAEPAMAMTDPRAYLQLREGATRMILSGF